MPKRMYLGSQTTGRSLSQAAPRFPSETDVCATTEESDVMTLTEAARYLKVSRQSLVKAVRNGDVPFAKINDRYCFSRAALQEEMRRKYC